MVWVTRLAFLVGNAFVPRQERLPRIRTRHTGSRWPRADSGALAVRGARAVALALLGRHLAHDQRALAHLLLHLLELLALLLVVAFALCLHGLTPRVIG